MRIVDLRELALQKIVITSNVIGKFGTFEIEQVYKNNTKEVLEVGYTFPIVETATVVGFEINVADRVLKGKCKEKGEAIKEYQSNIVKGNSAYMMEQETDNIFKISVGKIDIDEEVKIKIQYIDKFEIIDNKIEILIPTLITPRYNSNITSKLVYGKVDYTIDFNINIDKSLKRKSIYSPSHNIRIIEEDKLEKIEVLDYDLSRDFKLNIELKNELSSNAITSKTKDGKDIIYLSFMPEIIDSFEDTEKEYIFIIDVSGSMMGKKLAETKKAVIECLRQLDVGDKFNIIPFESKFEAMNINSIEYNEENMKKAIQYVNSLQALGGTEILNPIKLALYEKNTEKVILLFTDGQVGNENEIINYVNENINRNRIFPFGIDRNVNSSFIKQLAKVGNGKAELIQPKEKIDDKIIRTFARIQTPLLENIKVNYGINKVVDEIKEENCLFNYEFFNVFVKLEKIEGDVELTGKILNKEYSWKIKKEDIKDTNVDLELLFAKEEMERLEKYIRNTYDAGKIENYKKMIIEISEKYNINSKYTSFITVYEREDRLLEVPRYQETVLSDGFWEDAFMESEYLDLSAPAFLRKTSSVSSCDLDKPSFLRNKITDKVSKMDKEILSEKVEEYYKTFVEQEKKSILTYLLFAIYYLNKKSNIFNLDDLIRFLMKNKTTISSSEIYNKLLCICYDILDSDRNTAKNIILDLLDENYKKIALTHLRMSSDLNVLTKEELKEIILKDEIIEKIDDVLWYLCNNTRKW